MRVTAGLALVLVLPTAAWADDNATAMTVPPGDPTAGPPAPGPPPPDYYGAPPPAAPAPAPAERVKGWFATVGLGGAGYIGRPIQQFDDSDSGPALELVAGRWLASQEAAIGARLEAHTDDADQYTDSSLTLIARFAVAGGGRFYLEPGIGLAFHNRETRDETETGLAVAVTAGYALLKNRFALDLRGGFSHSRQDFDRAEHGLVWLGVAIGLQ